MNQILFDGNKNNNYSLYYKNKINKTRVFFTFQFIICAIITFSISSYYFYSLYENNKKENISEKLLNNFNITNLYNNKKYNAVRSSNENTYISNGTSFSVIGIIEIKSIQINYPILSTYNNELLKIAPCRFMGPMPNEVGNLCIAGHNYNSYKFFSKLKNLSVGELISIYDLLRKQIRL